MAKEKQLVIQEADITNNCPECFNQELKITFYQKHTFNALYHRTTGVITHEIKCKKCNSIIYPVNWTPDIERVFDYYNKLVKPDRPVIRFTMLFFMILVLILCVVAAGVYFYLESFN